VCRPPGLPPFRSFFARSSPCDTAARGGAGTDSRSAAWIRNEWVTFEFLRTPVTARTRHEPRYEAAPNEAYRCMADNVTDISAIWRTRIRRVVRQTRTVIKTSSRHPRGPHVRRDPYEVRRHVASAGFGDMSQLAIVIETAMPDLQTNPYSALGPRVTWT
jgi:hypothetical protein